jgi:hypothetical protein
MKKASWVDLMLTEPFSKIYIASGMVQRYS